jgi:O-antigen ligase
MENQFTDRFKDPVRIQLWETAMSSIKEKPLLGTGTGGMDAVMTSTELADKLGYPEPMPFSYPHNQYLGEVMQFGFIGALVLFGTLIYLLVLALRKKDFLLQSLLLILFIFMFTEMPLDSHKGINFFLFFISLFVVSLPLRTDAALKPQ